MATPNPVRGVDGLRELTAIAAPPLLRGYGNKKGPSREGPFFWFQSGAYCTITFLV